LSTICHQTGGLVFRPDRPGEGNEYEFEQEAFLNLQVRRTKVRNAPDLGVSMVYRPLPTGISREDYEQLTQKDFEFTSRAENRAQKDALEPFAMVQPKHAIGTAAFGSDARRTLRIRRELSYINNNVLDIPIWVNKAERGQWRAFLRAGETYGHKLFSVYVTFPDRYPACPPIFRFTGVPYHPNISPEGLVLFSLVDHDYRVSMRVGDIIRGLQGLLEEPEVEGALNREIARVFREERRQYLVAARESAERDGRDNVEQFDVAEGQLDFDPAGGSPGVGLDDSVSQLALSGSRSLWWSRRPR
jgi:ubiquitin-protein ligase